MPYITIKPLMEPDQDGDYRVYHRRWWAVDKLGNLIYFQNKKGIFPHCSLSEKQARLSFSYYQHRYPPEWECKIKFFEKVFEKLLIEREIIDSR